MEKLKQIAIHIKASIVANPTVVRSALALIVSVGILRITDAQADALSAIIVALAITGAVAAPKAVSRVNDRLANSSVVEEAESDEALADEIDQIIAEIEADELVNTGELVADPNDPFAGAQVDYDYKEVGTVSEEDQAKYPGE